MARLKGEGIEGEGGNAVFMLWGAVLCLALVSAIIFSCAGGVSKEKASATHTDTYGAGCAAGCGAACGG